MKALLLTFGSFMLTSGVILNAYYQKKQFYPSVVYITKSNPSMAVLYLQAFVFVVLMGKLCRKVFFGQLRAAEMEHLIERSWYAVTETCLAFTVFRDDFSPRFVALFTLLLFLKCFHWLGDDRVDYMERSPVISWLFHLRALSLIFVLGLIDVYFIHHAYYSTLIKGASVQLVFGFEYAILLTMVMTILIKYILHSIDLQSENPWENKAVYLLHSELVLGFVRMVLYVLFLMIMTKVHTFPLFAIRPMYLTMRAFKKALNDVIMSRRAIRNMNTLYPDATPEELSSGDNVCIICREDMVNNCKKLPCNHIFHSACLRSWFQRQQTCPTCRMDVLRPSARPQATQEPRPQPQEQPPQPDMFQGFPGAFPLFMPPQPPPQPPASEAGTAQDTPTTSTTSASPGPSTTTFPTTLPGMPPMPFMMPPFMMPMPPAMPMPPSDGLLQGLSEEELRAMEGNERSAVEARIRHLRDIQTLLDAAVMQMQQYSTVFSANNSYNNSNNMSNMQADATNINTESQATQDTATPPQPTDYSVPKPSSMTRLEADSTSPDSKDINKTTPSDNDRTKDKDLSELGAAGYTPPAEVIREWHDDRLEPPEDDELNSLRKRRLEKFTSQNAQSSERTVKDNLELD